MATAAERRAMLEVLREKSPAAAAAMETIFGDVLEDELPKGSTYHIIRFFAEDPAQNRTIIKTGLTLEEAQEHCNDPESSSSTCTNAEGLRRTELYGPWFDGYDLEPELDIYPVDGELRRGSR